MTLKIRSRSAKPNLLFIVPQVHANVFKIPRLVHEIIRFWLKFGSLSPALTLEIRSRSPNLSSSFLRPNVLSMQIWLKSAGWFMRRCARKKLPCQRRRDPYQKQYVSLPFGAGGGAGMIMQRIIFSLERLCSKTAPKY